MSDRQKTIKQEIEFKGVGLHTGNEVFIRLKPAGENKGITFVRVDLPESPRIKVCLENIASVDTRAPRCTSLGKGESVIHTVEHVMSAVYGLGIDNLIIDISGNEIPGLDGRSREFFEKIKEAGVVEQTAPKDYIDIKEPTSVNNNGASILIVPDNELKISYALDYNHPFLQAQFFKTTVNSEIFEREIAPSRTFCLEDEAQQLLSSGLGKGANYENTLVVGKDGVIKNKVRFPDEFARHKVLDLIGDLYLLGRPVRGQIFAFKSGHYLNIQLLKKISAQETANKKRAFVPNYDIGDKKELDIHQIMQILPHRYPFLLVDRIVELERGKRAVGIKNVTINEDFFNGHFPSRPIMPGVLMIEALAQTAGILVLTNEEHRGKLALFMATDKVKFRKLVGPGEQLVLEVEMVRDRSRTALLHGKAKVNGEVATEADIMLSFTDASFWDD